tara:strand:- start:540 stop:941 length:402 start_codon:yes stop_codon:yes gene_type:complete
MKMKIFISIFFLTGVTLFSAFPAEAHYAGQSAPVASLHIASSILHLTGFALMGIISELYRCYGHSEISSWTLIAPFALLMSHAHVPLQSDNGLIFAMGFVAAGYLVAILPALFICPSIKRFIESQQADSRRQN